MKLNKFLHLALSSLSLPLFRIRGNKIPFTTEIHASAFDVRGCEVGTYCYIGKGSILQNVVIGNYCSIAPMVMIGGMEHAIHDVSTNTWLSDKGVDSMKTYVGHDVWIATGSIIKQGITIGQGAVVGANSFVNKDVPPYAIVVGSPAKIIKYRFDKDIINELQCIDYQNLTPPYISRVLNSIRDKLNIKEYIYI